LTRLCVLFGFCLKAEARWPMAGQVIHARVEAPPLVSVAPAEKRKCGAKASWKTGAWWAPRSVSVRGHGRRSTKAVADLVLLEVEAGSLTSSHSLLDNLLKMVDTHLWPKWRK
jgi:hypothetical protein